MSECCGKFKASFQESQTLKAGFKESDTLGAKFGDVQKVSTSNYEELYNKPRIEGHTLVGDKTFPELGLSTLDVWEIEKILYLD